MKELRVKVTIRNNLLQERREALGMNQAQFAAAVGLCQSAYGALEAMKVKPIAADKWGRTRWRKSALRVAQYHRVLPEDLFPDAVQRIERREAEAIVDAAEISALLMGDGTANAEQLLGEADTASAVIEALATLKPREEKVLRMRMGFEGEPKTYDEIGADFELSHQRIRQIEAKALRKLRHPSMARTLALAAYGGPPAKRETAGGTGNTEPAD